MDALLLPGNNAQNKTWIHAVATRLTGSSYNPTVLEYLHWSHKESLIDLVKEESRIKSLLTGKKLSDKHIVFAKSVGVILSLLSISHKTIKPKFCVFVGTPLSVAKAQNIDFTILLKDFPIPVLFIQQTNDPFGSSAELRDLLMQVHCRQGELQEVTGDDHIYQDINYLGEQVDRFSTKVENGWHWPWTKNEYKISDTNFPHKPPEEDIESNPSKTNTKPSPGEINPEDKKPPI